MPTANPLEQLRRRLHAQASPAAFAALAEEHRRAGRLDEAIAVCRDGLARYPTYVSARVTLGRALLDSGDVVAAAGELEHAVAQAPDNLAAVRALEAARAACAELPSPPPLPAGDAAPAATADLSLQTAGSEAPGVPTPVDLDLGDALVHSFAAGPDAPQEFGLGPGWTIPDTDEPPAEPPARDHDAGEAPTLALHDHADAPTICFTPPPLQGDEPAGIWPVPDPAASTPASEAGQGAVPVFSWAIAAPGREDIAHRAEAVEPPRASIWDEPTIEAPVVAVDGPDLSADPAAGAPGGWDGLFADPPSDGAAPAAFAGWDAPGPGLPEPPVWSAADAPVAADAGAPATSAFTWGLEASEAESVPEAGIGSEHPSAWDVPAPDALPAEHDVAMTSAVGPTDPAAGMDLPAGVTPEAAVPAQDWAGSVASALDEVFEQARFVDADEPPTPTSPALQAAMADAAVEAALEDTVQGAEAVPPALASLQRLLDNVRARRAALFTDLRS